MAQVLAFYGEATRAVTQPQAPPPGGGPGGGIATRVAKLGYKLGLWVLGSFIKEMAFLVTIGTQFRASSKVNEGRWWPCAKTPTLAPWREPA